MDDDTGDLTVLSHWQVIRSLIRGIAVSTGVAANDPRSSVGSALSISIFPPSTLLPSPEFKVDNPGKAPLACEGEGHRNPSGYPYRHSTI